jgi:hypothetical protein
MPMIGKSMVLGGGVFGGSVTLPEVRVFAPYSNRGIVARARGQGNLNGW